MPQPTLISRNLAGAGRFRADLLDRLTFDVVALPALRDRTGDIPLIATHFATRMTAELGRPYFAGFADDALAALEAYSWPGNVRELRNVVERSVCRMNRTEVPLTDVVIDPFPAGDQDARPAAPPAGFHEAMHEQELRMLRNALEAARFNQKRAAASLGLSYDQFRRKLRAHHLTGGR